jgi:hypothetical protein
MMRSDSRLDSRLRGNDALIEYGNKALIEYGNDAFLGWGNDDWDRLREWAVGIVREWWNGYGRESSTDGERC